VDPLTSTALPSQSSRATGPVAAPSKPCAQAVSTCDDERMDGSPRRRNGSLLAKLEDALDYSVLHGSVHEASIA
jgi:hypothetical protein